MSVRPGRSNAEPSNEIAILNKVYGLSLRSASMSAATRLLKKLDKVLSSYDSFGDDPTALVDEVVAKAAKPLDKLLSKSKPELMAEIYVERDRALIKQEILNRVMAG